MTLLYTQITRHGKWVYRCFGPGIGQQNVALLTSLLNADLWELSQVAANAPDWSIVKDAPTSKTPPALTVWAEWTWKQADPQVQSITTWTAGALIMDVGMGMPRSSEMLRSSIGELVHRQDKRRIQARIDAGHHPYIIQMFHRLDGMKPDITASPERASKIAAAGAQFRGIPMCILVPYLWLNDKDGTHSEYLRLHIPPLGDETLGEWRASRTAFGLLSCTQPSDLRDRNHHLGQPWLPFYAFSRRGASQICERTCTVEEFEQQSANGAFPSGQDAIYRIRPSDN